MASKSVGVKGRGDKGLEKPEPKRRRGNKALVDNAPRRATTAAPKPPPKRRAGQSAEAADDGSEIGRRVGRTRGNLKRVHAREGNDRSLATSKEHTARRNVKLDDAGMSKTLEDSATGKPSRKSTRKSANRTKESQLARRTKRKLHSPKSRATRARTAAG